MATTTIPASQVTAGQRITLNGMAGEPRLVEHAVTTTIEQVGPDPMVILSIWPEFDDSFPQPADQREWHFGHYWLRFITTTMVDPDYPVTVHTD